MPSVIEYAANTKKMLIECYPSPWPGETTIHKAIGVETT